MSQKNITNDLTDSIDFFTIPDLDEATLKAIEAEPEAEKPQIPLDQIMKSDRHYAQEMRAKMRKTGEKSILSPIPYLALYISVLLIHLVGKVQASFLLMFSLPLICGALYEGFRLLNRAYKYGKVNMKDIYITVIIFMIGVLIFLLH